MSRKQRIMFVQCTIITLGNFWSLLLMIVPTSSTQRWTVAAFPSSNVLQHGVRSQQQQVIRSRTCLFGVANNENKNDDDTNANNNDDDNMTVLNEITHAQLEVICVKYGLSSNGEKSTLMARIKDFVTLKTATSEDDMFYFTSDDDTDASSSSLETKSNILLPDISDGTLPISTNEKGQKVVTFFDSEDRNDQTAFHTGSAGQEQPPLRTSIIGSKQQEETTSNQLKLFGGKSKKQWEKENQQAKEACIDLISTLLATTGAPAFADEFGASRGLDDDDDEEDEDDEEGNRYNSILTAAAAAAAAAAARTTTDGVFTIKGFNPSSVRGELLEKFSKPLRAGQVLKEAIREFEIQACGHDGKAADDVAKGGGHYKEVQKVSAFLEGYRRAEVRRIARTTATIILDAIAVDGVQGLDTLLSTTSHGDEVGELNEALVEYLNDLIRSQEEKVETENLGRGDDDYEDDLVMKQDNYTFVGKEEVGEDGEITETIDMNDPIIRKQMEQELKDLEGISEENPLQATTSTPSEQLLLLLKLVRERIKVEAAFKGDERSKNLRLLAYCLKAKNDQEVEFLITNGVGGTLDTLNIFADLISSSIEYAESSSFQLAPSTKSPLNIKRLQNIQLILLEITSRQKFAADSSPLPSFP